MMDAPQYLGSFIIKKDNTRILPLDTHRVVGKECHAPNLSQRTNTNELRDRLGKQTRGEGGLD